MAFTIDIPDDVIDASIACCNAGNMGNRGDGSDGTKEQQMIGIIGQNMLHLAAGLPLMKPGGGFDGGVDIMIAGLPFDIKTMGRKVTPRLDFVNNLMYSQTKFKVDGYIFSSVNTNDNRMTVCGWLPKALFLERATLFEKGAVRQRADKTTFETKAAMYEIENSKLFYSAKSWQDLFAQIHHFSQCRDEPRYQTIQQWIKDYDNAEEKK
jgi:hypothetical protein